MMTTRAVRVASDFIKTCPYCGSDSGRHLGLCSVCSRSVCERCGNIQFVSGERKVTHKECLHRDDGAFKMIKFVR
jgi:hypothetical protein